MMRRMKFIFALIALMLVAVLMFWATSRAPKSYDDPLDAEFHRHELSGRDLIKYARWIDAARRCLLAENTGVSDYALDMSRKSIEVDSQTGSAKVMFRFGPGDGDYDDESDDRHVAIYVVEVSPDLTCRFKGLVDFHPTRR